MSLSFPNITPQSVEFGIEYNTQVAVSQLSGVVQTVELPGARWKGKMSFRDLLPEESTELKAFLLRLRGSSGRFYIGDLSHPTPSNFVTGNITILSGSFSRAIYINYESGSDVLSVGDYIQIGDGSDRELKMIVSHAASGADYLAIVEPFIRRASFIGQPVYYNYPTGIFMLTSSDQAMWSVTGKALLNDIDIEFVEVFA